jgi:hypothetical protein
MSVKDKYAALMILLLMLVNPMRLCSQVAPLKSKLWIEGRAHYGFILSHHDNLIHLTSHHFSMFALDVQERTNGDHLWERQYHLPIRGVSLLYSNLGRSPYLGSVIAALPYLDFNLTRKQNLNLFFRLGAGVGVLTKHFDRVENYKNIAIGSHFNAGIQLMFAMRWHALKRLDVSAGFGLTHFSNGCIQTPNLGINIVTMNLGLAWKLDSARVVSTREVQASEKHWEYSIFAISGLSELYPAGGPKYPAFVLSGTFLRGIGYRNKMKIGPGADIFYDEAIVASFRRSGAALESRFQAIRPGVNLSYKLQFARLGILLQVGTYLYSSYKKDGYIYDRFSLQYTIADHYVLHLGLKTHFFVADMIEYGFGYKF